jgi:protocatechuate 3,4-dioxygenase beta subunit
VQKNTSSSILSVAILVLLGWAMFSGKKPGKPEKNNKPEKTAAIGEPKAPSPAKEAAPETPPAKIAGEKKIAPPEPQKTAPPAPSDPEPEPEAVPPEEPAQVPTVLLSGKVSSAADGSAVAGAQLVLLYGGDQRVLKSDSGGRYELAGLLPGSAGYFDLVKADGFLGITGKNITLPKDLPSLEINFSLQPLASLGGRITAGDGKPVTGAAVSLRKTGRAGRKKNSGLKEEPARVLTGPGGLFEFRNIHFGLPLELLVEHLDYINFQSEPFKLGSGQERENFNIELSPGNRIGVLLLGPDQAPRPTENISLWRFVGGKKHPWAMIGTQKADSAGKTIFGGLKDNTYSLRAGGINGTRHATKLLRVAGNKAFEETFELEPELAISGVVRNGRGEPVEGSLVKAFRNRPELGQKENASDRSDPQGRFRIGTLGEGSYLVTVQSKGYLRHSRMIDSGSEVTLTLQQYGRISGQVVSLATGKVVKGAEVELKDLDKQKRGQGLRLNAEGFFKSPSLLPGNYELEITAPKHRPASLDLQVGDGKNIELVVELERTSP